jgi:hypothetical protein
MHRGYTQAIEAFAFEASKLLVNERSNEVVNITSTEMMNKWFAGSVALRHCEPTGRANARPMTGSAKQSSLSLDCFVAALLAMTVLTQA